MSEIGSDNMSREETGPRNVKVVDSFTKPGYREPHRMGEPLPRPAEPNWSRNRMSRRAFIGKAGPVAVAAAGVAVTEKVSGGGVSRFFRSLFSGPAEQNKAYSKPEPTAPPVLSPEIQIPPIDREIVKIQRGQTIINKTNPADLKDIKIRRDAQTDAYQGTEAAKPDNKVPWDQIKSINGEELGSAVSFAITDAPLVIGQPVENAGQGFYWIKLNNVELKSGEKTILYISRSEQTKDYLKTSGPLQDPVRDAAGKINEPNMGRVTVASAK